eukprot:335982-Amphidinium_carterae.1
MKGRDPIWEGSQPDNGVDLGEKSLSDDISEGADQQCARLGEDLEPTGISEGDEPEVQRAKWIGKESK